MKKTLICLLIFIFIFSFTSCTKDGTSSLVPISAYDSKEISQELSSKIKIAYNDFYNSTYGEDFLPSNWAVGRYCGNYNGCEIVFMQPAEDFLTSPAVTAILVAGYKIMLSHDWKPLVYNDGEFYSLEQAYELEFLSELDVYEIGKQIGLNFAEEYPAPLD